MCDKYCTRFYEPIDDEYQTINCKYCKEHINEVLKKGDIHILHFVCDKEHTPLQFMRVVYRYRNWYGKENEFLYYSETHTHYDFMKLCVDSQEIKHPIIYEAFGCYDGLSENGNPLWILLNNPKEIKTLHVYKNEHKCEFRGLDLCEGCGICE